MNDREKNLIISFKELLPKLNRIEREKILSFGEGLVFAVELGIKVDVEDAEEK